MTSSVHISFRCPCVENREHWLPPHLKQPSHGLDDPSLCGELLVASTSIGSECPRPPCSAIQISPPHTSQFSNRILLCSPVIRVEHQMFLFNFLSCGGARRIQIVRLGVPNMAPSKRIERSKFIFLPPVVGSCRFCSLRQASNGFFRKLATMSSASQLVRAMSAVHLLQHELQLGFSLHVRRSRQEFEIDELCCHVHCSADHSNIISDSLITLVENTFVFFDHC